MNRVQWGRQVLFFGVLSLAQAFAFSARSLAEFDEKGSCTGQLKETDAIDIFARFDLENSPRVYSRGLVFSSTYYRPHKTDANGIPTHGLRQTQDAHSCFPALLQRTRESHHDRARIPSNQTSRRDGGLPGMGFPSI